MYLPSMTYRLGNSFLTQTELEDIEKQPLSQILSKCGINNKTSIIIVSGPQSLGGHSYRPLYQEQGVN